MNKIDKVTIDGFWGDKEVKLDFKDDVNFLIGVNGSGKTTIINLIAATLKADYSTLNRSQFKKIHIDLKPIIENKSKKTAFIEVEKKLEGPIHYYQITYRIKRYSDSSAKKYSFDEDIENKKIWYSREWEYAHHPRRIYGHISSNNDISSILDSLVNVSWLTIHRVSTIPRKEERGFESTIDQKVGELQIDLVKYFSKLNGQYALETEKFQKYIFESLIDTSSQKTLLSDRDIDAEKEKNSLKQIFHHFNLPERTINDKLDSYFKSYTDSAFKLKNDKSVGISDLTYILGIRRIHAVVQEWSKVIEKQKKINKSKETFLTVINSLLQRKALIINEKNELTVKTQSGKVFPLTNLSSGEKQLLIILGQSLLQEENIHIYIADEPELSLHVEWQEKLVSSLKSLNPNSQIIFATHSPDIVGEFGKSVIKIEEAIK